MKDFVKILLYKPVISCQLLKKYKYVGCWVGFKSRETHLKQDTFVQWCLQAIHLTSCFVEYFELNAVAYLQVSSGNEMNLRQN